VHISKNSLPNEYIGGVCRSTKQSNTLFTIFLLRKLLALGYIFLETMNDCSKNKRFTTFANYFVCASKSHRPQKHGNMDLDLLRSKLKAE
jgi:hypothetical protein